jgi:hypothetical protein
LNIFRQSENLERESHLHSVNLKFQCQIAFIQNFSN